MARKIGLKRPAPWKLKVRALTARPAPALPEALRARRALHGTRRPWSAT
ncbi:MAG: hypothetical protein ACLU98_05795 [Desulfovibrio fairfieldensis]